MAKWDLLEKADIKSYNKIDIKWKFCVQDFEEVFFVLDRNGTHWSTRLVAAFLAFVMLLGNVPANVFATEITGEEVRDTAAPETGAPGLGETEAEVAVETGSVHTHEYTSMVTAPTCAEQGYTTYTCTHCGYSYQSDKVKAKGHSFGDWTVVSATTCTENGEEQRTCKTCKEVEVRIVAARGHSYEALVTAPTCTEPGYTTFTCACGDSYLGDDTAPLGHSFEGNVCIACGEVKYAPGNVDMDDDVDVDDVLALLWYVLFPEDYPIEVDADFDRNGSTDVDDVLTLLWYVLFPEDYPLN